MGKDPKISSDGPEQFSVAAPMQVNEPGHMWDFDPNSNPVLDEIVGDLGDDVLPVLADPPELEDRSLIDIGPDGLEPTTYGG